MKEKITYEEQLRNNVDAKEILIMEGHIDVEFDPDGADLMGGFEETALSEIDALEARFDFDTGEAKENAK